MRRIYVFTLALTLSSISPAVRAAPLVDLNRDLIIDLRDFAEFQNQFNGTSCVHSDRSGDIDRDGCVALLDFGPLFDSLARGCGDPSDCGVQNPGQCLANSFPNPLDPVEVRMAALGLLLNGDVADAVGLGAANQVDLVRDEDLNPPGPNGDEESPRFPQSSDPNGFNIGRTLLMFFPDNNPADGVDNSFIYVGWNISDNVDIDGIKPVPFDSDDNGNAATLSACSQSSCAVSDLLPEAYQVFLQGCTNPEVFDPALGPQFLERPDPFDILTDFDSNILMQNIETCLLPLGLTPNPGGQTAMSFPTADGSTNKTNACIELERQNCAAGNDVEMVIKRVETSGAFGAAAPDSPQAKNARFAIAQLLGNFHGASEGDQSDEELANVARLTLIPEIEVSKRVRCAEIGQTEFTQGPIDALAGSIVEYEITVANTGNVDLSVTLQDVLAEVGQQAGFAACEVLCDFLEAELTSPRRGIVDLPVDAFNASQPPICSGFGDPQCLSDAFFFQSCDFIGTFLEGIAFNKSVFLGTLLGATVSREAGACAVTAGDTIVIRFRVRVGAAKGEFEDFCSKFANGDCENAVSASATPLDSSTVIARDDARIVDTASEIVNGNQDDNVNLVDVLCREISLVKAVGFPGDEGSFVSGAAELDVPSVPPGDTVSIEYVYAARNEGEVTEAMRISDPNLCADIVATNNQFAGSIVLVTCPICPSGTVGPQNIAPGGNFGASCVLEFNSQAALRSFLLRDDGDPSCVGEKPLPKDQADDCYQNCAEATGDAVQLGAICRPESVGRLTDRDFSTICNAQCAISIAKQVRCLPDCSSKGLGAEDGWIDDPGLLEVTPGACVQYRVLATNSSPANVPLCAVSYNDFMSLSNLFQSGPTNVQLLGKTCSNLPDFASAFNWSGVDVTCVLNAPLVMGESMTVLFEAQLANNAGADVGEPRNNVTVSAAGEGDCPSPTAPPTFSCEGEAGISIDIRGCDFEVEKDVTCDDPSSPNASFEADDLADALPGAKVGFRIQVCNLGEVNITKVDLTDELSCASWFAAGSVKASIDGQNVLNCICPGGVCNSAADLNGLKDLAPCKATGIEAGANECLTITFEVDVPANFANVETPEDCVNTITVRGATDVCSSAEGPCPERTSTARINVDVPDVACDKQVCLDLPENENVGACDKLYPFAELQDISANADQYPITIVWRFEAANNGEVDLVSAQACDTDLASDLGAGIVGVVVGACPIVPSGCADLGPIPAGGSASVTCSVTFNSEAAWQEFALLDSDQAQFCYENSANVNATANTEGLCDRNAEPDVEAAGCEAQVCITPGVIPTVSEWGLVILALLLLTLGKLRFGCLSQRTFA